MAGLTKVSMGKALMFKTKIADYWPSGYTPYHVSVRLSTTPHTYHITCQVTNHLINTQLLHVSINLENRRSCWRNLNTEHAQSQAFSVRKPGSMMLGHLEFTC